MQKVVPRGATGSSRNWSLVLVPVFGVLLVVALWSAVLVGIAAGERKALESELRDANSYVFSFEAHVRRTLRELDRTLQLLKSETERTGQTDLKRLQELGLIRGAEVNSLSILNRHGDVVASNRFTNVSPNFADRDYFRHHAEVDTGTMDISRPFVGRVVGRNVIVLSRRLNGPKGEFAGVAMISISPTIFTDFYVDANLGAHGVLGIFGLDGAYRVRRMGADESDTSPSASPQLLRLARDNHVGSYVGASPHDGVVRLVAYRRLPEYPLVVMAARSTDEAFSGFRGYRNAYLALAIAGTLVILPFFGVLYRVMQHSRQKSARLRNQREFLLELLDNIPLGISVRRLAADGSGEYVVWNETNALMYGAPQETVVGRPLTAVAPPDAAERVMEWDRALLASPAILNIVEPEQMPTGETAQIHRVRAPIFDAEDEVEYVITVSEDVTRQKAAEDDVRLASKVFETTTDGIVISGPDDRIITVNAAFTRLTGYAQDEMLGQPVDGALFAPLDADEFAAQMTSLHRDGSLTAEVHRLDKNGRELDLWLSASVVRDNAGAIVNHVRTYTDISRLKGAQRQLEQLVNIDVLTGLPNRRRFHERLEHALQRARRSGQEVGLLFLDLDGFKSVNDNFGHDIGDELLRQAAGRLASCMRATDAPCRLGGDEFTVILEGSTAPDHAIFVSRRIQNELAKPFLIGNGKLHVGTSIGIAFFPAHGLTAADLVGRADQAMYQAKQAGGNRYVIYREPAQAARMELAADLAP